MFTITPRQQLIIAELKQQKTISVSDLFTILGTNTSERTLKRDLADLVAAGILMTEGGGRSLVYSLPTSGRFFIPIDALTYNAQEPDRRAGAFSTYQFDLSDNWPKSLFSKNELSHLTHNTDAYQARVAKQSPDIHAKELERFIIELSWKSSRIEGNTYTLLDTELLLREGVASKTNTPEETTMILNHKTAFDFVRGQVTFAQPLTRSFVEQVHTLLMTGLITDIGLRKNAVGITGSTYKPLDNQFQIIEELEAYITLINKGTNGFDQALTALLSLSYLQPFVDGNKRTARLVANALLLSHKLAPLSYRNVNEVQYRASLLAFYEQLSVLPMKQIFIDQYIFATEHYS
jgi:Fic family protein